VYGIVFPGEISKSNLTREAEREILITNQSGIEIESPRTHTPLTIALGFWTHDDTFGYYENLQQYRVGYPKGYSSGGRKRTVGYALYKSYETEYRGLDLRLNPGAAYLFRFQLGDVWSGSLSLDSFGIIVKAAAGQPLVGIWKWDKLERMQDRLDWPRKRRYPTVAETEDGGIIRIALRYIDKSRTRASEDAAFVITLEDDDRALYTADLSTETPDQAHIPDPPTTRNDQIQESSIRPLPERPRQRLYGAERGPNSTEHHDAESDVIGATAWHYDDLIAQFVSS
jgi:hypothetical protein